MLKETEQEKEEEKRRMDRDREEESQSLLAIAKKEARENTKVLKATVFQIVML